MTYPKLLRPWLLALVIAPLSPALPVEAILDFTRPMPRADSASSTMA